MFELHDTKTRNLVAVFDAQADAVTYVVEFIARDAIGDLVLGYEDEAGSYSRVLRGPELEALVMAASKPYSFNVSGVFAYLTNLVRSRSPNAQIWYGPAPVPHVAMERSLILWRAPWDYQVAKGRESSTVAGSAFRKQAETTLISVH